MPGSPVAATVSLEQLVSDINAAVTGVLQKDVAVYEGYNQRQVQAMAQQTLWIAQASVAGQLTPDLREFFLKQLEDSALVFAKTLAGLAMITIEKVWNAVVGVLWSTVNTAISSVLPPPQFPRPPGT
jgi:molybdopterin biosynthesis enzyme